MALHAKRHAKRSDRKRWLSRPQLAALATVALAFAIGTPSAVAAPPHFSQVGVRCVPAGHAGLHLFSEFDAGELETHWSFAYSTTKGGPWTPVPGGNGTITQAEALEAPHTNAYFPAGNIFEAKSLLTNLTPEVVYYILATLSNASGEVSAEGEFEGNSGPCETEPLRPNVKQVATRNVTATSVHLQSSVEARGFATRWRFEYATSEGGPWTVVSGGEGAISQAEAELLRMEHELFPDEVAESINLEAELAGLKPGTAYDVRLAAESEPEFPEKSGEKTHKEVVSTASSFETFGPPSASTLATRTFDGEALRLLGTVDPNSQPTSNEQTITIGGAPTGGAFSLTFKGQSTTVTSAGTVTAGSATVQTALHPAVKGIGNLVAQSREVPYVIITGGSGFVIGAPISGPGIPAGDKIASIGDLEEPAGATRETVFLEQPATATITEAELTSTAPEPFIRGEHIAGAGIPVGTTIVTAGNDGVLTLSADATASASGVALAANIPFDATAEVVERALRALPDTGDERAGGVFVGGVFVSGPAGGPYVIDFSRSHIRESAQPQIEADGSGLTPSGIVTVTTDQEGGEADDTHYHFEYVSEAQFNSEGGFAEALSTPEVDLGSGVSAEAVGADLSGLQPGVVYRYRVVAGNNSPGNPVVDGEEESFTAPAAVGPGSVEACPNEALRTGPSARLPDCRAYEQVTPVDKEGTEDIFTADVFDEGVIVSEDGDHLMMRKPDLHWGANGDPKISSYFFTRDPRGAWQMTSARPAGETGPSVYLPALYDSDLTQLGLESFWETGLLSKTKSPAIELKVGPPGGPYGAVASLPRSSVPAAGALVAGSADLSKLVFRTTDRVVVPGHRSATTSGEDLYEYSADGGVRQVNVGGDAGVCGATMPRSNHGGAPGGAVSADGSRVFFEAAPVGGCGEPEHLYMRVNGAETVDIGAYAFVAANRDGTELLLDKRSGETHELVLYDTASAMAKLLATTHQEGFGELVASEDLSTIYFLAKEQLTPEALPLATSEAADLYRYEVAAGALRYLGRGELVVGLETGPDGRYLTFTAATVAGVPAAGPGGIGKSDHIYRYDSAAGVVQCLDCGPTYTLANPNPSERFQLVQGGENIAAPVNGTPRTVFSAGDGDYVFFDTTQALVPQDVDTGQTSTDVYEWRAPGVDDCTEPQGCLALITGGRGGVNNELLGVAAGGRDVFFATHESLVGTDADTAGDIYDARIGGGSPTPTRPTECEGDACSTPFAAPNDLTPSSATFHGAGDVAAEATPPVASKAKPKPTKKQRGRKTGKRRGKRKVGRSVRARHTKASGRAGR